MPDNIISTPFSTNCIARSPYQGGEFSVASSLENDESTLAKVSILADMK